MAPGPSQVELETLLEHARRHMHARMDETENAINNAFARVALKDQSTKVYPIMSSALVHVVNPPDLKPAAKPTKLSLKTSAKPTFDTRNKVAARHPAQVGHQSASSTSNPIIGFGEEIPCTGCSENQVNGAEYDNSIADMQKREAQPAFQPHAPPAITALDWPPFVYGSSHPDQSNVPQRAKNNDLTPYPAVNANGEGDGSNKRQLTHIESQKAMMEKQIGEGQGLQPVQNSHLALVRMPNTDGGCESTSTSSSRQVQAIEWGPTAAKVPTSAAEVTVAAQPVQQANLDVASQSQNPARTAVGGQYPHHPACPQFMNSPSITEHFFGPKKRKKVNKPRNSLRDLQVQEPDPEDPNILPWESWALRLLIQDRLGLDEAAIREYLMIEFENALLRKDRWLKSQERHHMRHAIGAGYSRSGRDGYPLREVGYGFR